jgi:hypothetical protein
LSAVKTAAERSSEMMVTATSVRRQFVRPWSACWRRRLARPQITRIAPIGITTSAIVER